MFRDQEIMEDKEEDECFWFALSLQPLGREVCRYTHIAVLSVQAPKFLSVLLGVEQLTVTTVDLIEDTSTEPDEAQPSPDHPVEDITSNRVGEEYVKEDEN